MNIQTNYSAYCSNNIYRKQAQKPQTTPEIASTNFKGAEKNILYKVAFPIGLSVLGAGYSAIHKYNPLESDESNYTPNETNQTVENNVEETLLSADEKLAEIKKRATSNKEYNYFDGKLDRIEHFDKDGNIIALTQYNVESSSRLYFGHVFINSIVEFGKDNKIETYYCDGKTIDNISEYGKNGKIVKQTGYNDDGKTINYIQEYDKDEKIVKTTYYKEDGVTIDHVVDADGYRI